MNFNESHDRMKFEFVSRNATRDKGPSPLLKTIYWFNWYNNRIDVAAQLMSTALTQNLLLEKLFIRRLLILAAKPRS